MKGKLSAEKRFNQLARLLLILAKYKIEQRRSGNIKFSRIRNACLMRKFIESLMKTRSKFSITAIKSGFQRYGSTIDTLI